MLIAFLAAAAPQVLAPPAPPPPPMVMSAEMPRPGPPPEAAIVEYALAEVRCRGAVEQAVLAAAPLPTSAYLAAGRTPARYQLAFRIAADGRPLGISDPNRVGTDDMLYVLPDDLAPALAASRFAPGAERRACVATYEPTATSVLAAPKEVLHRYLALPRLYGPAHQPASKRLRDEAPGCFKPTAPRPLLRGFPDFDAIPQASGTFAYTMVGFDVSAAGVPTNVRTLSSDGNAALDHAGIDAIGRSRFIAQPRTGCSYPYHRRQTVPLAAPPTPERDRFVQADANCDNAVPWAKLPPLVFPDPFRRRAIEGWAVVRYDVAPWGATGNIEVLASEPAAAFGEAGKRVIAGATRPRSATGATGCVDRVLFKMAGADGEPNEGSADR
jgi:TonB family protein